MSCFKIDAEKCERIIDEMMLKRNLKRRQKFLQFLSSEKKVVKKLKSKT